MDLLTRDIFRESVFKRDGGKCVICNSDGKDAHHIVERRLFREEEERGGYFLDNGATLCETHHLQAESTELGCDIIREKIGIKKIILPSHLYDEFEYDKWGNIILNTGDRLKGELFYDESVQKILDKKVIFSKYIKYPRTFHLPNSTLGKDDRILKDESNFLGKRCVVTLKMDGENTTMYNDYIHARSINSNNHESRNWVKGLWAQIKYLLDENMRICGENLYAKHSISYDDLESYFMTFSIWMDNQCLDWESTKEYSQILGLNTVPVIYQGEFDLKKIHTLFEKEFSEHEGYVIRLEESFLFNEFHKSIAKYVKPQFKQIVNSSHGHWISKKIEPNKLK